MRDVTQLKMPDLEGFIEKALKILEKRKSPDFKKKERELIDKIKNGGPSAEFWKKFDALSSKLEREVLTEVERKESEKLVKIMEQWTYERLLLMKELAKHWDTSLDEIPKRLKLKPRARQYA